MDKTIVILDKLSTDERKGFWTKIIDSHSSEFSIVSTTSGIKIKSYVDSVQDNVPPFIIFAHNSDIQEIEKRSALINGCVSKSIPLVLYSGGSSGASKQTNLFLDNLHVSVLEENIEAFLSDIKALSTLEGEKLEFLVAIDPKLEKLLSPFASTSPYETTNKQGKILKDAKAELQTYVGEYLKKQSKS